MDLFALDMVGLDLVPIVNPIGRLADISGSVVLPSDDDLSGTVILGDDGEVT